MDLILEAWTKLNNIDLSRKQLKLGPRNNCLKEKDGKKTTKMKKKAVLITHFFILNPPPHTVRPTNHVHVHLRFC